jgi:hypothetical protein
MKHARLQLIECAGHHMPRRAPGAVAEAIVAFLTAADSGEPAAGSLREHRLSPISDSGQRWHPRLNRVTWS